MMTKFFKSLFVVMLVFSLSAGLTSCIGTKKITGEINDINQQIINYHLPSLTNLYKMYVLIYESKELTRSWTYVYKPDDANDRVRLRKIHTIEYPEIKKTLDGLKKQWPSKEQQEYNDICDEVANLFEKEKSVMQLLSTYESYEDVMTVFQVDTEFERGENSIASETEEILNRVNALIGLREATLKGLIKQQTEGQ